MKENINIKTFIFILVVLTMSFSIIFYLVLDKINLLLETVNLLLNRIIELENKTVLLSNLINQKNQVITINKELSILQFLFFGVFALSIGVVGGYTLGHIFLAEATDSFLSPFVELYKQLILKAFYESPLSQQLIPYLSTAEESIALFVKFREHTTYIYVSLSNNNMIELVSYLENTIAIVHYIIRQNNLTS
jgi:hypothetical protein